MIHIENLLYRQRKLIRKENIWEMSMVEEILREKLLAYI